MRLDLTNKQDFLKLMSERVMLREGPVGVENVLKVLFVSYNKPGETPMDERVLARISRLPVPVVSALCKEFANIGLLSHGLPLRLDEAAVRLMSERWGWSSTSGSSAGGAVASTGSVRRETARCANCEGTGVVPSQQTWGSVLEGLRLHNLTSAPETLVRMVALMHEDGAMFGKDVLVLGGSGAVAGAVALAGKALSPTGRLVRRVVFVDPQERNLVQMRDVAEREGTIIGLVRHDLRAPLPQDLREEFETIVVTSGDDMDDLVAMVGRASEAVKEKGRVYLLCPPLRGEEKLDAQREMVEAGLAFERAVPRFDSHPGAEMDLYVLGMVDDD
jgi:predicted methyltransferase